MTPERMQELLRIGQEAERLQGLPDPTQPAPMPGGERPPLLVSPAQSLPSEAMPSPYAPPPLAPPQVASQAPTPNEAALAAGNRAMAAVAAQGGGVPSQAPPQAPQGGGMEQYRPTFGQRFSNALAGAFGKPTTDYAARAQEMVAKQQRMDEFERLSQERERAAEAKRLQDNAAQARAAELADPSSKASRGLQKLHSEYLKAAGLTPDQIAQMPGSALADLDLQKSYGELVRERFKATEAKRKQDELLAKEGRANAEWDRRVEAKKQIAAAGAGILGGAQGRAQASIGGSLEAQAKAAGLLAETPDKDNGEQAALRARIGNIQGSLKRGKPAAELVDQIQREIDQAKKDEPARYRIPGWSRRADAPEMQSGKVEKVRDGVVALRKMEAIAKRIKEIDRELGAMERIGGAVGLDSDLTAEQMQLQRSATTQLRIIANMGVPSLNEMAIVNQQAPELTSITGWLNGTARFGAMVKQMRMEMDQTMDVMGYDRAARRRGAEVIE